MQNIYILSLGCPKNLADSENMLGILQKEGYQIVDQPQIADVIIVNTCGFIQSAKEESIEETLQMAEYKKTGQCKKLILAGCLSQRYAKELLIELTEVDAVTGAHAWPDIACIVKRTLNSERFIFLPEQPEFKTVLPRLLTEASNTAYLKIAEGCDNVCSYCAIPLIRGPYVSKPLDIVLSEARQLAKNGIREIVLVAQDVTRYGEDFSGKLILPDLLQQLCHIDGIEWIRILYAYPQNITDELIETIAKQDKICKYIDIPLQHISDTVLNRMNRRDCKTGIINLLNKMRKNIPDLCIRTTFIVGFPGETEEEFAELIHFVEEQRFDRVGIFTYSLEEGTVAADMQQLEDSIKEERYKQLSVVQAQISEQINISLEGKELIVIIDDIDEDESIVLARSYREAPEIDGVIYLENTKNLIKGKFVKARVEQGFTYDLLAEVIN